MLMTLTMLLARHMAHGTRLRPGNRSRAEVGGRAGPGSPARGGGAEKPPADLFGFYYTSWLFYRNSHRKLVCVRSVAARADSRETERRLCTTFKAVNL